MRLIQWLTMCRAFMVLALILLGLSLVGAANQPKSEGPNGTQFARVMIN